MARSKALYPQETEKNIEYLDQGWVSFSAPRKPPPVLACPMNPSREQGEGFFLVFERSNIYLAGSRGDLAAHGTNIATLGTESCQDERGFMADRSLETLRSDRSFMLSTPGFWLLGSACPGPGRTYSQTTSEPQKGRVRSDLGKPSSWCDTDREMLLPGRIASLLPQCQLLISWHPPDV